VTLVNDTFFKNTSVSGGGFSFELLATGNGTSTGDLTSLTVYNNLGTNGCGGAALGFTNPRDVAVDNCIFDGNTSAPPYTGAVDIMTFGNLALTDKGYNLVGSSDAALFDPINKNDIIDQNNNPGLANALAANGALAGYPQTLDATHSLGYEKGDGTLFNQGNPKGIDARGLIRQQGKVSIGAEDPDAQPPS
jgi:hypothetical protein